jgi:hypothetical protein
VPESRRRGGLFSGLLAALAGGIGAHLQHGDEVERATDALTAEAQRQVLLQYESADAQDIKTIGMIAAAIASAAFVASTEHDWRSFWGVPIWTVPMLLLGLSIGAFLMSLWHQRFQRGPNVPVLYRTFSGTMMEAKGRVLRELIEALEHNKSLLRPKAHRYSVACWLLAGASVATAIAMILSAVS